jgi:hypothetical protein
MCIDFHMIIYMISHMKILWHINVHWLSHDNLRDKSYEIFLAH